MTVEYTYTPAQTWLFMAYWWLMGAMCGIGIGAWIYKKLGRLK